MRDCVILGCGRSGTSLVAGSLAEAGYFMGDRLYPGRDANPKGFFESPTINTINEVLISRMLRQAGLPDTHSMGQRWLVEVPVGTEVDASLAQRVRIRRLQRRQPYCFKDPRFTYTLPAWQSPSDAPVRICVFRDPGVTAASILKEVAVAPYLHDVAMDGDRAMRLWTVMYSHVLDGHAAHGSWLFLHADQLIRGDGLDRLEGILQARPNRGFPDASLQRSPSIRPSPRATELYERLLERAAWSP